MSGKYCLRKEKIYGVEGGTPLVKGEIERSVGEEVCVLIDDLDCNQLRRLYEEMENPIIRAELEKVMYRKGCPAMR